MEAAIAKHIKVGFEKMTSEDILKLSIEYLRNDKKGVARNFSKLPPVLQNQLWEYQYCMTHCYQDDGDQVDGPPVQIMDCIVCIGKVNELKLG